MYIIYRVLAKDRADKQRVSYCKTNSASVDMVAVDDIITDEGPIEEVDIRARDFQN